MRCYTSRFTSGMASFSGFSLFLEKFADFRLNCAGRGEEGHLLGAVVGGWRGWQGREKRGRAIEVIETILHNPRVKVAAKAGQISLLGHNQHAIGLVYRGSHGLLVERSQRA